MTWREWADRRSLVEMMDFQAVRTSTIVSVRLDSLNGARSVSRLGKCRAECTASRICDGFRRATLARYLGGC